MTPPARPVPSGSSADITRRQNQPDHLARLRAYSRLYSVAQRWRRVRVLGTLILAITGPLLALSNIDTKGVLGAISAAWLILGRTVLSGLEQRARNQAVTVHELYDTELFRLPWNDALAGRRPLPDDVAASARRQPDHQRFHTWFTVDLAGVPWPADVLLCQRQSTVWGRGDHRSYATTVAVLGAICLLTGVAIAVTMGLTLADYLVKLFLPTAPALLDSIELSRSHRGTSATRTDDVAAIDDLYEAHRDDLSAISVNEVRAIQDASFTARIDTPRVPGWFYKIRRQGTHADTAAGVDTLRRSTST
ncbi:S-4TM family putative pore-forming effector [Pseudonocardia saturnea]